MTMLLAHIAEFARSDNSMDVSVLPQYHVLNDPKLRSRLSRMPKVVHPLSERFSSGENCPGPGVKNRTLMVELKSDKRYVHLVKKPTDNEVSTQDMSVIDDNGNASITRQDAKSGSRRELIEKTKSLLRQLTQTGEKTRSLLQQLAQTGANASEETCNEPKEKQFNTILSASSSTNLSTDLCDTENATARHRLTADAVHHCDRRRKTKPSAMEETWKMLDSALFRRTKSQLEKCSDKSLVKSVHYDKKQFTPILIPLQLIHLPPELVQKEHHVSDPRLTQSQQRKDGNELDLPLPKFVVNATLAQQPDWSAVEGYDTVPQAQRPIDVDIASGRGTEAAADAEDQHRSAQPLPKFETNAALAHQLNGSAVEGCETMLHAQRPIDVVIGAGRVTEAAAVADDQHRDARFCLMQSLERNFRILDVLSETEFCEFSRELIVMFQDKVAEAISKHHDTN